MRSLSYSTDAAVEVTDHDGNTSVVAPEGGQVTIELGGQVVYLDGQRGTASVIK